MTTDARHSKLTPSNGGVHVSQAKEYANEAARTGDTGLTSADIGVIARQTDNESFWILTDDSPVTWEPISCDAMLATAAPADVTKAAAAVGTGTTAARVDHKHDVSTATAGALTPGDSASEGTATSLARSDHQHGAPAFGSGAGTFCEGNDSRLSDARTPTSHASSHQPGGGDAMAVDAAAATGSLRTLGTGAQQACAGNDSRLSDARTPTAHATSHQSGGSDAVKLDDLAAPDDNTDLDASTSQHGLLPKLGGGTVNFLRADGSWAAPSAGGVFGTQYNYQEKTTLQTTTSTSWQQYTRLTTPSLPAGTYRIGWMYVWNINGSEEFELRVQVDDTTNLINPGDSVPYVTTEPDDNTGDDERICNSGFRHITLSAATHDIDIDFRASVSGNTVRIYHGQIELWRVS